MSKTLSACLIALSFASVALAENSDAARDAAGDQEMHGPMTRMPKNEKADKSELDKFFKSWEGAWMTGDLDGLTAMVDYPVLMLTDDSKGTFVKSEMTQDQWVATMKPMIAKMQEKKAEHEKMMKKASHKTTCFMLSDDLASCEGEMTMSGGKMKGTIRSQTLLTRAGGAWKVKSMVEAGWGDKMASASSDRR